MTKQFEHLSVKQQQKMESALNVKEGELTHGQVNLINASMEGITNLIKLCGDNPERDGLHETPFRVVKAFAEYTQGYSEDPGEHLRKTFDVQHNDLVLVKDIEFYSMCEHHFAPFFGKVHIGYIPNGKITGLSKFARVVDGYAKRFQVQERLTNEILDAIGRELDPEGIMVVVEAQHMCMCSRGVKKSGATTVTSAVYGAFQNEPATRAEFLSIIGK